MVSCQLSVVSCQLSVVSGKNQDFQSNHSYIVKARIRYVVAL
ncbi:hypothetical protein [Argonema antarcticum]|nr:hypothetical protein [Argonema antarcticum]